jgi:ankyrin repeat protein
MVLTTDDLDTILETPDDLIVRYGLFHMAVQDGDVDNLRTILDNKVININGTHKLWNKRTPLQLATAMGKTDMVNYLLEKGAHQL